MSIRDFFQMISEANYRQKAKAELKKKALMTA